MTHRRRATIYSRRRSRIYGFVAALVLLLAVSGVKGSPTNSNDNNTNSKVSQTRGEMVNKPVIMRRHLRGNIPVSMEKEASEKISKTDKGSDVQHLTKTSPKIATNDNTVSIELLDTYERAVELGIIVESDDDEFDTDNGLGMDTIASILSDAVTAALVHSEPIG